MARTLALELVELLAQTAAGLLRWHQSFAPCASLRNSFFWLAVGDAALQLEMQLSKHALARGPVE
jgi:hypothetical protein